MKLYSNIILADAKPPQDYAEYPLFILHGFLGMGDNWKTLAKKIAGKGFEVHLIDQRNHGRSPHSEEFSYELMANDLLAYCEDKKVQKCVLLGHSMGGKTAMQFACQYAERVHQLIIADIAPKYYPQHHQNILDALQSLDFDQHTSRDSVDKALQEYISENGIRQFLMKNLFWKEKGVLGLRMHLNALAANISEIGIALSKDFTYLGETLVIKGEKSDYIAKEDEAVIKMHFPNAIIKTISGAGHWLHAERPTEFLELLMCFVKK